MSFQDQVREENSSRTVHSITQDRKGFKIGVIGGGFVGGAVAKFFKDAKADIKVYDKFKQLDSLEDTIQQDFIFVAVPTPYVGTSIDLSIVEEVFGYLKDVHPKAVIIKSTVIPGTTEKLQKEYPHLKVLFNPEFLTEKTADADFSYPDRQIIGYTEKSFDVSGEVLGLLPLAPYVKAMPSTAAEMVKYFGNTWFAVKVTFANQMYDLCQALGTDYYAVAEAASQDKRIGRSHLDVLHGDYRGYGGKCLPKDTRALIAFGKEMGVDLDLLQKAEDINSRLTGGIDKA